MLIVKNIGTCQIRIGLPDGSRFLIPVGGVKEVSLPDEVKDSDFFNRLVSEGTLVVREEKQTKRKSGKSSEEPDAQA